MKKKKGPYGYVDASWPRLYLVGFVKKKHRGKNQSSYNLFHLFTSSPPTPLDLDGGEAASAGVLPIDASRQRAMGNGEKGTLVPHDQTSPVEQAKIKNNKCVPEPDLDRCQSALPASTFNRR